MTDTTKPVAYVVTTSGIELIGFVDYGSVPKFDESGEKLIANSALGTLTEIEVLVISRPVKSQLIMTQSGPRNTLIPVTQMAADAESVSVRLHKDQIMYVGKPHGSIESSYVEGMSGIALPKGAGSLNLVKG